MRQQLSLLDWHPPPELMVEPEQPEPEKSTPNQHAIRWWEGKLRFYQQLQIKTLNLAHDAATAGNANPGIQRMRRHEISRLQALCDECKAKLEGLKNGCSS